jgi:hypothetical protein
VAALTYAFVLLLVCADRLAAIRRSDAADGCVVVSWRNPVTGRDEPWRGRVDAIGHPVCP